MAQIEYVLVRTPAGRLYRIPVAGDPAARSVSGEAAEGGGKGRVTGVSYGARTEERTPDAARPEELTSEPEPLAQRSSQAAGPSGDAPEHARWSEEPAAGQGSARPQAAPPTGAAQGAGPSAAAQNRGRIRPGARVLVVQKAHQPTGELTEGIVSQLLTSSAHHPRGVKVRLASGVVGRVQQVLADKTVG